MTQTRRKKGNNVTLSSPISLIEGLGPKRVEAFARLGVFTLEDMFFLMPRRYEDRRNPKPIASLMPGTTDCTTGTVSEIATSYGKTEAEITDSTGSAGIVWFTDKIGHFLHEGMRIAVYGQLSDRYIVPKFTHPEFEILKRGAIPELIGKIFPIYPGTAELTQKIIKKFVALTLDKYSEQCLKEFLPQRVLERYGMMSFREAITQIHGPSDELSFVKARNRLAFDEFFLLQAGVIMRRNSQDGQEKAQILVPGEKSGLFMRSLPFGLTGAQERACGEIIADMQKPKAMNRLLQGDVGSGKTIVAVIAMLAACDSNAQAAFMAPTEILAQQHYLKLEKLLAPLGLKVALLTGSLKTSARKRLLDEIYCGNVNIVVGTHAIFSEDVDFLNLALVIVDEQHRFGVLQRGALIAKGKMPHVLTMTATPIPRTLILSVYGDLEVSVLNELPPGRQKIRTISLKPSGFRKVPKMIHEHISRGEQVYWVCPMIDEGERDLASVNDTCERLREILPEARIAVLHGRLPVEEKSAVMQEFAAGNIDVLVATVVIEVGVDVPNATMIVIEDAGQFGLAQLHQLRGRVGRGKAASVCVLLENQDITPEGRERVNALVENSDGFELAEEDLRQRGAGEICGTHQHGVTDFRVADFLRDEKILALARDEAKELLERDPELRSEPALRSEIVRRLGGVLELAATS
ncbi:MAG: ATP-dependent DNA helicase RecG [Synergistaceae bacterium]|nr:ATP-dependent DNA helicase RecG [Synergistaceae bacterium]